MRVFDGPAVLQIMQVRYDIMNRASGPVQLSFRI